MKWGGLDFVGYVGYGKELGFILVVVGSYRWLRIKSDMIWSLEKKFKGGKKEVILVVWVRVVILLLYYDNIDFLMFNF